MTYAQLLADGYTEHRMAISEYHCFEIMYNLDEDIDGTFRAYDLANNEWVSIDGWSFSFEEM